MEYLKWLACHQAIAVLLIFVAADCHVLPFSHFLGCFSVYTKNEVITCELYFENDYWNSDLFSQHSIDFQKAILYLQHVIYQWYFFFCSVAHYIELGDRTYMYRAFLQTHSAHNALNCWIKHMEAITWTFKSETNHKTHTHTQTYTFAYIYTSSASMLLCLLTK